MKRGRLSASLFLLFRPEPSLAFGFGSLGVEARPPVPRFPALPIGHEERVADDVHGGEEGQGRAKEKEGAERIGGVGMSTHGDKARPRALLVGCQCKSGFSSWTCAGSGW